MNGRLEEELALLRILYADLDLAARFAFAYASSAGLDSLVSPVASIPEWQTCKKEWIVGIHHGITEPFAIERLAILANSQVRVFVPTARLDAASLAATPRLHAKVIAIDSGDRSPLACVIATSANLTSAALGPQALNFEAGLYAWSSPQRGTPNLQSVDFNQWWNTIWRIASLLSDALLARYSELRRGILERNQVLLAEIDPPSLSQVRTATNLWIEAGAMSGGSRNQVEFGDVLTTFFGPVARATRHLSMQAEGHSWGDRPLAHKMTTFGVDIWRLSLPTRATGGFDYPGKVIRFTRLLRHHKQVFTISVSDPDGRSHAEWRARFHRTGYVGVTGGNRQFGFY